MNICVRKRSILCLLLLALLGLALLLAVPAAAAEDGPSDPAAEAVEEEGASVGLKAISCGLGIGLAAAGGAIAMGIAVARSTESVARQPEAEGKIRTTLMLGLVFIETAIIYALLAVILIIFVL